MNGLLCSYGPSPPYAGGLDLDGAKETRTPDPLHAMQVLYQLSYGPRNIGDALRLVPLFVVEYTPSKRQICRHTATSWPCTCTCSPGITNGS